MAVHRIVCVNRAEVPPKNHDHIVEVGIGTSPDGYSSKMSVDAVIASMDRGNMFIVIDSKGEEAVAGTYRCECGYTTLRTDPDPTVKDNLDALPPCA